VLDATSFGPIAPQPGFGLGSYVPGDPTEQSEDCLTLNIWAPASAPEGASCAVLVFFHGGSFLTGSGAGVMYRGEHLARLGVVVVTVNYRLGVLGYLAHRDLSAGAGELFANFGLADQVAALSWINTNVAAFGGDPDRVTCFGESAGAMSIADLLVVPEARGLFARAILQSGAELAHPLAEGERLADSFARTLGIEKISRAALVSVPFEELLAAQVSTSAAYEDELMSFRPVVDGRLVADDPARLLATGAGAPVDLLAGINRDEFKFFTFSNKELVDLDDEGLVRILEDYAKAGAFGAGGIDASEVVDFYRELATTTGAPASGRDLLDAIGTDLVFDLPSVRLAEAHGATGARVYRYRFDWPSPFADGALGACHGLELPFVFKTIANPVIAIFAGSGERALGLADEIQASWVAFATTGDPSNERVGKWPAYEPTSRATMCFGPETMLERDPRGDARRFWSERLPRYGG
jgi:para-nitrobenzyl esterase